MAWGKSNYHFKSKADAISRAKAVHCCLDCRHTQTRTYKECPNCGSKNRQYFMSSGEHKRGINLLTQQEEGFITELEFQVPFMLHALGGKELGKYIADFRYRETGQEKKIIEDFKGSEDHITDISKWKIAHFEAEYNETVKITT